MPARPGYLLSSRKLKRNGRISVLCREGYIEADGLLAHLANVDALLKEALKIADLTREVHGPRRN